MEIHFTTGLLSTPTLIQNTTQSMFIPFEFREALSDAWPRKEIAEANSANSWKQGKSTRNKDVKVAILSVTALG